MTTGQKSDWLCVSCGLVLGEVLGGELHPSVPSKHLRTSGPNLAVTCPDCGRLKIFYTADPVVRALFQLINAMSETAAASMVAQIGATLHSREFSDGLRSMIKEAIDNAPDKFA